MRKPDLNALEFEELWDLHRQLTEILAHKIVVEKRELEARLEKLNRSKSSEMSKALTTTLNHHANIQLCSQNTGTPWHRRKRGLAEESDRDGSLQRSRPVTDQMI